MDKKDLTYYNSLEEKLNVIPTAVIPKPVLFNSKKITPEYLINTIKKLRKQIGKSYNDANMLVPGCASTGEQEKWLNLEFIIEDAKSRSMLRTKYLNKNNTFMERFLPKDSVLIIDNKSHSWRKLYAAYSYKTIGELSGYEISSWYRVVLYQSSLTACFRYMTLTIRMGLKIDKTSYSELLTILASYKSDIDYLKSKVQQYENENVRKETALPGIEDDFVYLGLINQNQFGSLGDSETHTAFEELYNDLEMAGVDMFALTQQLMMNLGLKRAQWRYFNREILSPKLNDENTKRVSDGKSAIKRRRIV
jgi:hypothetical protein